ncbi:MAG: hypothetical protein B5766_08835 [Candidatus Lumbricidophila eiseniae]|uniref:Uncharacterized protein n=1 Tax=Candidatus Lumbricidiphila eiseniae TaxID=1969409 RepID=A0A2A6FQA3_9MICO|nr:MAG: hypothetical protein B5766_08835 [Candidatus Lumbricidophila eiseniae]
MDTPMMMPDSDETKVRPVSSVLRSPFIRAGQFVLCAIIGVFYGAATTTRHRTSAWIGTIQIPWGLVLCLVGFAALLIALRLGGIRVLGRGFLPALGAALGVLGSVSVFTLTSSGGSQVVVDLPHQLPLGTIWQYGVLTVSLLVLLWPRTAARHPHHDNSLHHGGIHNPTATDTRQGDPQRNTAGVVSSSGVD